MPNSCLTHLLVFFLLTPIGNISLKPIYQLVTLLLGAENVPATKANNHCLASGYASPQNIKSVLLDDLSNVNCDMNVMVYEMRAP